MPNIKSAKKRVITSAKKKINNTVKVEDRRIKISSISGTLGKA